MGGISQKTHVSVGERSLELSSVCSRIPRGWMTDRAAVSNGGNYLPLLVLPLFQPSVSLSVSLWSQLTVNDDILSSISTSTVMVQITSVFIKLGLCDMVINMIGTTLKEQTRRDTVE